MYTILEHPEGPSTEMPIRSSVARGGAINEGNEVGGHGRYSLVSKASLADVTEGGFSHEGAVVSKNGVSSNVKYAKHSSGLEGGPIHADNRSSEETAVEEVGHINDNGTVLPFIYIPSVPDLTYYAQPLNMYMEPMMSQEEYEKAFVAKIDTEGYAVVNKVDKNEMILVVCLNKGTDYCFELSRATLERSSVLKRILASGNFLQGSETLLRFIEDPAKCFQAVKIYLEEGSDCFTAKDLEFFAMHDGTTKLSNTATIRILAGLHKLAVKLGLKHLWEMTMSVLEVLEYKVDAFCCMNLANLVFGQGFFGLEIENFTLTHVGKHFNELNDAILWHETVEKHRGSRLGTAWVEMDADYKGALAAIKKGGIKPEVISRPSIPTVVVHAADTTSGTSPREAVKTAPQAESAPITRNDDPEYTPYEESQTRIRPQSIDKARELLGIPATLGRKSQDAETAETAETYGSRVSFDNNYKARKILGMNSDGGGKINGRRKQSIGQKARIRAARAAEKGVKKVMG